MDEHTNPSDPTRPPSDRDDAAAGQTTTSAQEPPHGPPQGPPQGPPRRLHRRTDQEVIGGVCAGLGAYFRVDPVVFRLAFVIAAFASGAGVIAYLIAWAILPDESGRSELGGDPPADEPGETPPWVWVALAVAAVVVLGGFTVRGGPSLLIAAGLVALGILLVRRDTAQQHASGAPGTLPRAEPPAAGAWGTAPAGPAGDPEPAAWGVTSSGTGSGASAVGAYPSSTYPSSTYPPPTSTEPPRPTSPIVRLTLGLAVLAIGVMLAVEVGTTSSFLAVAWTAVPLAIVGLGLVLGAVLGGARALIGWGVILLVALLLTVGGTTVVGAQATGFGERIERPQTLDALAETYSLGMGELDIDLRSLDAEELAGASVTGNVGIGSITVRVGPEVPVHAVGRAGVGQVELFGREMSGGVGARRVATDPPAASSTLDLDLRAGIGEVVVVRS